MKNYSHIILIVLMAGALSGCEEFLDAKPQKSLVVPNTIENYRAILDNAGIMNTGPVISVLSDDDFYTTDLGFNSFGREMEANSYIWAKDVFGSEPPSADWFVPYEQIFYSNIVLDGIRELEIASVETQETINGLKGAALFYRANAFYNLLRLFAPTYVDDNEAQLGIPLKLTSSVEEPLARAGLIESYRQVIDDLNTGVQLLPTTSEFPTRPNKITAHALLSRIYLAMQEYDLALEHANKVLDQKNELIDYKTLPATGLFSFSRFNPEVIYHNQMVTYGFIASVQSVVAPELFSLYEDNDLRKRCFFRNRGAGGGLMNFTGNYTGNLFYFNGIGTNEMYLIKAECLVRKGDVESSLDVLRVLLQNRYQMDPPDFQGISDRNEALDIILRERRKELLFRGLRWDDLKRFNTDPEKARVLTRTVNEVTYTLPPNDPRYVFPIPEIEIQRNGFQQNMR